MEGIHVSVSNLKKLESQLIENEYKYIQIFAGSPRSLKRNFNIDKWESFNKIIDNLKVRPRIFVHLPYTINIGKEDINYDVLKHDFFVAKTINAEGCVIHVGKNSNMVDGINFMFYHIQNIINRYSTDTCKLLLETPAGQGTELLTNIDAFNEFCNHFKYANFGTCLDTCHVWSSGYNPIEYIKNLEMLPILIHYNDCKQEKGCRKDRHAIPGEGIIENLTDILEYNLPYVCEPPST